MNKQSHVRRRERVQDALHNLRAPLDQELLGRTSLAAFERDPGDPVEHLNDPFTEASGAKVIRAVNDRWGTPTYTHDFALNLFRLLDSRRYGTYHMVCEGSGTRYDVARAILDICGKSEIELIPVDSSYFAGNYFAPRPVSEMMTNANLRAIDINLMRPWREALDDYIRREFPHAIAGQERPQEDRRVRTERRKQAISWNGPERRKTLGRRESDLGKKD